jgi:SOS response associated peptidase (SRAP)
MRSQNLLRLPRTDQHPRNCAGSRADDTVAPAVLRDRTTGRNLGRMCGRFLNKLPAAEIARIFGTKNALSNYPARFNIAPTDPVLVVRFNQKTNERSLDALRWGLVPHWAKDLKFGARCINARAETVQTAWRGSHHAPPNIPQSV